MAEKLPSGMYRKKAYYTDETGKRRSKSFTAKTKREANYLAEEFQRTHKFLSDQSMWSLEKAVESYIEINNEILSPSTIRGYNIILRNHIDDIKNYPLFELNDIILQRWMNSLTKTKSPKTCKNAWGLVSTVCKRYYPEGVFHINLPQRVVQDVVIPQREDIRKLLDETEGTEMYPVILLGAHMGLRRSEISALTWDDIDLKNKQIRINKAKVRGDYGFEIKQPKTVSGNRVLDMTDLIYDYFSKADRSLPPVKLSPSYMTTQFKAVCKKLGLPFHQHLLRHYFASVCAAQGLPESYAAMLMGHSSYDMIRKVYGHILDEEERKARKKITDYMNEK